MAGSDPLVSVIIPAYGVSEWIASALDSVLRQTVEDLEVILINDGSPDSAELEEVIGPFRSRIHYFSQPNAGAAAARNAGLKVARGTWVAFLDGDDTWEPTFLSEQLALADARQLDLVWSDGWFMGDTPLAGRRISTLRPSREPVNVKALLTQTVYIGMSASMVRRSHLSAVGGFDDRLRRAQDFELWVRLLLKGAKAGYNPAPLIRFRVRDDSLSGSEQSQIARAIEVLTHIRDNLSLSPEDRLILDARLLELLAQLELEHGKRHLVEREYEQAIQRIRLANLRLRTPKLRLVIMAIRVLPSLTRWLYLRQATQPLA